MLKIIDTDWPVAVVKNNYIYYSTVVQFGTFPLYYFLLYTFQIEKK